VPSTGRTSPLGTAGALATVPISQGTFLVSTGRAHDARLSRRWSAYHEEAGGGLTIAMRGKRVKIDLGVIEADGGLVSKHIEKPSLRYQVSMGATCRRARAEPACGTALCSSPTWCCDC